MKSTVNALFKYLSPETIAEVWADFVEREPAGDLDIEARENWMRVLDRMNNAIREHHKDNLPEIYYALQGLQFSRKKPGEYLFVAPTSYFMTFFGTCNTLSIRHETGLVCYPPSKEEDDALV